MAPAAIQFNGTAQAGWTLTIGQASPVFAFLKKNMANKVHMVISYAALA